ncbi:hypothetical protein [Sorangium sp. So ce1151]|uniref:hypothetical protein n=1 Tax=Sorangium sp. So ce1151 TaxID=3133332 RepID=UPI003F61AA5D
MEPPPELPGGLELRGELMLVQTNPLHAFDLRSAVDGSLLATVSAEYDKVGLASDGSYAWTLDNYRDLTIWSPSGDEVLSTTVSRTEGLRRPSRGETGSILTVSLPISPPLCEFSEEFEGMPQEPYGTSIKDRLTASLTASARMSSIIASKSCQ